MSGERSTKITAALEWTIKMAKEEGKVGNDRKMPEEGYRFISEKVIYIFIHLSKKIASHRITLFDCYASKVPRILFFPTN